MSWINDHQRLWRAALSVLFVGAVSGPWVFDKIHVPAEYPCHAPNVRIEGDFCGVPLPGAWVFVWIAGGLVDLVTRPLTEAVVMARWAGEVVIAGLTLLLFAAPVFNLLLLLFGRSRLRWRVIHAAAWGLALGVALWGALLPYPRLMWEVWGLWLYIALALGVLALEALGLAAEKRRSTVGGGAA